MKALLGFLFLIVSVCPVAAQSSSSKNGLPDTPEAKPLAPDNGEPKPAPSIGAVDSNKNRKFSTTTKLWVASSLAVYTAASLDMHATEEVVQRGIALRKRYPGLAWLTDDYSFESNPFARPFLKLPAPAYSACGAALATGVNWAALRMSRSKRFRKVWWIPQAVSVAGNLHGYSTY
jgi:hypothetical protein